MNIIETKLQFSGLRSRSTTKLIVLHHSASPDVSAAQIHGWHLALGWAGIGYHFVIRKNGVIERGRPLGTIGAHAGAGVNGHSIGICLNGNFMQESPSPMQIKSLLELINWLNKQYVSSTGASLDIKLHHQVSPTQCPGVLFPTAGEVKKMVLAMSTGEEGDIVDAWKIKIMEDAKKAGLILDEHQPDDPAPKWFVLTVALRVLEIIREEKGAY
ncbi:MAG TPA: N-acetylmuramoyl-L-alanine amidase [Syntrophomonadaceae bacterium]|nr:N-acetylmuramoyl-L-alanine amidase [Syntrophomonadaceae bacterium]